MPDLQIVDLHWTGRPRSIASALLDLDGVRVLVDPGPQSTLPRLRAHLESRGLSVHDLAAILLTHIHLDHAGATGSLVRENPRLSVYVHEFGAPHMADPSRLLASAGKLYGADMQRLFGDFLPVPAENLHPLRGGETLSLGRGSFRVLYTPGHASHHVTYWDSDSSTAFVGDTAGICVEGDSFILPAVPPPDINLELWNRSLDDIASLRPSRLFLTHFGFSHDPQAHIARYRERLESWAALVRRLLGDGLPESEAARLFVESVSAEIAKTHSPADAEHYVFNGGLQLSWLGLARYIRKQAAARHGQ
jgi:glyoxylase-like metal-dependent hydrolase (beta-lactamase superfamily II)